MTTMETRPFWPYSYILWKVVYGNTRCRSIILLSNLIWRYVHEICSSSPLHFSFLQRSFCTVFYVTAT